MTWKELLARGEAALEEAEIEEAKIDAWYLLEQVSGKSRSNYFMEQTEAAPFQQEQEYLQLIRQRGTHIPLQHLTGRQEFMGLDFQVGPQVLIPRPETELLVERLLPLVRGKRVLELGTGSGCIAISLAVLGRPERVDAIDLSPEALQIAGENARRQQAKVSFWQSDLFEKVSERYDIIVSNPPYISSGEVECLMPEVREHEPRLALDGGEDGLDYYRRIAEYSGGYLSPGGMVWLEIGYDQREAVCGLFREKGFHQVECFTDLSGRDRIVQAVWDEE